ncbi:NlpD Membrane proteins related to metalloendopeptidases [Burkholderiaceae bacterium]
MRFKNHSTSKPSFAPAALPLSGQQESRSGLVRGVVISSALVLGLGAVAFGFMQPSSMDASTGLSGVNTAIKTEPVAPEQNLVLNIVPVPAPTEAIVTEQAAEETPYITETRIRSGDTLATVLKRLDVSDANLLSFLTREPKARSVYKLIVGRSVQAATDDNGDLLWVRYFHTPNAETNGPSIAKTLQITAIKGGFVAEELLQPLETHIEVAVGTIRSSLFAATDIAGIPDGITLQMADVLSNKVDFLRGLRTGDQFRVVYETRTIGGRNAGTGRVLALEFINGGKIYNAVWFSPDGETGSYYNLEGESLRGAFLRNSLKFSRISSTFGMRKLPGLQAWSGHHAGVDYSAPTGTPIHATADGTVDFVGWQNGYGNTVILKHHSRITTLYAHQSHFAAGLKAGMKVSQGDLIGYVGSTGWSTGPHLHYEFRVADKPIDPLTATANMPTAKPLADEHREQFAQVVAPFKQQLQVLAKFQEAVPETSSIALR